MKESFQSTGGARGAEDAFLGLPSGELSLTGGRADLSHGVVTRFRGVPETEQNALQSMICGEMACRFERAAYREAYGHPARALPLLVGYRADRATAQAMAHFCPSVAEQPPLPESFVVHVGATGALVAASDYRGLVYGVHAFLSALATTNPILPSRGETLDLQEFTVYEAPRKRFRGIRMYLPGAENMAFFERFVRSCVAPLRYNTLILETNAAMELDSHPELNVGWYRLGRCLNYTRRSRPEGPHAVFQDSTHHDTGDFAVVPKHVVAQAVAVARRYGLAVIPEIPSLTHAYYLLSEHREFAEISNAEWPDTYLPTAGGVHALYQDVLREYVEVMNPRIVHIGHDEWRIPKGQHPAMRYRNYGELFVQDVLRSHSFLATRGIGTAMWADHLIQDLRGGEHAHRVSRTGYRYETPGALSESHVNRLPRDILMFNWFWDVNRKGDARRNQLRIAEWGFPQVYGNFRRAFRSQDYYPRSEDESVIGGAVSSWEQTDELNFAKDLVPELIDCAALLWATHAVDLPARRLGFQQAARLIRTAHRPVGVPSAEGQPAVSVEASTFHIESSERAPFRIDTGAIGGDTVLVGSLPFRLLGSDGSALPAVTANAGDPHAGVTVPIDVDCSSISFLHACLQPGNSLPSHTAVYNQPDTAELVGWYEVEYVDGLRITIPLRIGAAIHDVGFLERLPLPAICPLTDPVPLPVTGWGAQTVGFYAYEWRNPRFGKATRHVRLRGAGGFRCADGTPAAENAVVLLALSYTPAASPSEPSQAHRFLTFR